MLRGPLYRDNYHPQLSGHETFPIRYGWLKKAFDAVRDTEEQEENRQVFTGPDAIARFGVGKNMVASMRHWASVTGIIADDPDHRHISTTPLGDLIFGDGELDPYMEHPATAWLLHWQLCGRETKTTWFWAFHYYPSIYFEREALVQGIHKLAEEREWPRASVATIRRDVSCFIRTYVPQTPLGNSGFEDGLESPLTELGLIKPTGRRGRFPIRPRAEAVSRARHIRIRSNRLLATEFPQRQHFVLRSAQSRAGFSRPYLPAGRKRHGGFADGSGRCQPRCLPVVRDSGIETADTQPSRFR